MDPAILYEQSHLEPLFVFACCYLKLCGHFGHFCKLQVPKMRAWKAFFLFFLSNPDYGYHQCMHNLMAFPNNGSETKKINTRCCPEHCLITISCTLIGRNATLQYPALRKLYIFKPTAQFLYFLY